MTNGPAGIKTISAPLGSVILPGRGVAVGVASGVSVAVGEGVDEAVGVSVGKEVGVEVGEAESSIAAGAAAVAVFSSTGETESELQPVNRSSHTVPTRKIKFNELRFTAVGNILNVTLLYSSSIDKYR
jgi:hypothetical protein